MVETESSAPDRPPAFLLAAAFLVALQGAGLLALAVVEVVALSRDRLALGITTAVFFVALAGALVLCARGLARVQSWARSPVVVAELLQLLTAWSFRGGETTLVAVGLAGYAVVVLACVMHPASARALAASSA